MRVWMSSHPTLVSNFVFRSKVVNQSAASSSPSWIDFKIPAWGVITLVVGLLGQTATLLIWGAKIDDRVAQNERQITEIDNKLAANAKLAETVARVDERTQALVETVNRIDQRMGH